MHTKVGVMPFLLFLLFLCSLYYFIFSFFFVFLCHFSSFFSFFFFLLFPFFFLIQKLKMDFFPLKTFLKCLAGNLRNIFLPELEPKYPHFWNFDFCFPENARFWNFKLDFFPLKKVFEIFSWNTLNNLFIN